jgi:hypothetical protein
MPHFPPVIFGIAFAALIVALSALARRLPIPTPILQLVAGLALGLAPRIATPELDPDLVFFVFLRRPVVRGDVHVAARNSAETSSRSVSSRSDSFS